MAPAGMLGLMIWQVAADIVVLIHAAFILFAAFGAFLVAWRRWWVWVHVPAAAWAALVVLAGWLCPLTPVEQWLRELAGENGYSGSFIDHYVMPLIYPPGLTRNVQVLLGLAVLVLNAVIYGWVFWRHRRLAQRTTGPA